MRRLLRNLFGLTMIAGTIAVVTSLSPAFAKAAPIQANGSMACRISGTVHYSPRLTMTNTVKVKLKLKMTGCSYTSTNIPPNQNYASHVFTLTDSGFSYESCGCPLPPNNVAWLVWQIIHIKTTPIDPSDIAFSNSTKATDGSGDPGLVYSGGTVSESFAESNPSASMYVNQTAGQIAQEVGAKGFSGGGISGNAAY
jgi:hypothetical protein